MGRQEYLRQMYLKNRGLLKDTTVSDLAYLDTAADSKNATYTVNDLNLDTEIDKQSANDLENTDWWSRFMRTGSQLKGNMYNGILDFFEGIGDAAIGIAGTVGSWFGADSQWAKDIIEYDWSKDVADFALKVEDTINPLKAYQAADIWDGSNYLDKVNQDSLFALNDTANEWVSNIETMVGNMLPSIALDIATGGATVGVGKVQIGAGLAGMGVSAMGGGIEEALGDGAKRLGSATLYGFLSGVVETGTELIGGDRIAGITSKPFTDSLFKNLTKAFVSEGVEEVMSDLVNPIIQLAYKDNDSWENVGKHFMESYNPTTFAPELFQSFVMGGIGGLIFGGTAEISRYGQAGKYGYQYLNTASEVVELREQLNEANEKGNQKKIDKLTEKLNAKVLELTKISSEIGNNKKAQAAIVQQFLDYNDVRQVSKDANDSLKELWGKYKSGQISIDEYDARSKNISSKMNSDKFLEREFKMTEAGLKEGRFYEEDESKKTNEKKPSKEDLLGYKKVDDNFNDALEENVEIKEEAHKAFKDSYSKEKRESASATFTNTINDVARTVSEKLGIKVDIRIYDPTVFEEKRFNSGESVFNIVGEDDKAVIYINNAFVDDVTGEIPNAVLTHEMTHTTVQLMSNSEIDFLGELGNKLFEHSSKLPSVDDIKRNQNISEEQRKRGINNEIIAYALQTTYQRVANNEEVKSSGLSNVVNFLSYIIDSRENLEEKYSKLGEQSVEELKESFNTEEEVEKYLFKRVNSKYFNDSTLDFIYEYAKILSEIRQRTADIATAKMYYSVGLGGSSLSSNQKGYYSALVKINEKFKLGRNFKGVSDSGVFRVAEVLKEGKTIAEVNWQELFAKKAAIKNIVENNIGSNAEDKEDSKNKKITFKYTEDSLAKNGIGGLNDVNRNIFDKMISEYPEIANIIRSLNRKIEKTLGVIDGGIARKEINFDENTNKKVIDIWKEIKTKYVEEFKGVFDGEIPKGYLETFEEILNNTESGLFETKTIENNTVKEIKQTNKVVQKEEKPVPVKETNKKGIEKEKMSKLEKAFNILTTFASKKETSTWFAEFGNKIKNIEETYKKKGVESKDFSFQAEIVDLANEYEKVLGQGGDIWGAFSEINHLLDEYGIDNLSTEQLNYLKIKILDIKKAFNKQFKKIRGKYDSPLYEIWNTLRNDEGVQGVTKRNYKDLSSSESKEQISVETDNGEDSNAGVNEASLTNFLGNELYTKIVESDIYLFGRQRTYYTNDENGNRVEEHSKADGIFTTVLDKINNQLEIRNEYSDLYELKNSPIGVEEEVELKVGQSLDEMGSKSSKNDGEPYINEAIKKSLQEAKKHTLTEKDNHSIFGLIKGVKEISSDEYFKLLKANQNYNGDLALPDGGLTSILKKSTLLNDNHKYILLQDHKGNVVGAFSAYYDERLSLTLNDGVSRVLSIDTFVYSSDQTEEFAKALKKFADKHFKDMSIVLRMKVNKNLFKSGSLPNLLTAKNQKGFSIAWTTSLNFNKSCYVGLYYDPYGKLTAKLLFETREKNSDLNKDVEGNKLFKSYDEKYEDYYQKATKEEFARQEARKKAREEKKQAAKNDKIEGMDDFLAMDSENDSKESQEIEKERKSVNPSDEKYNADIYIVEKGYAIPELVKNPYSYNNSKKAKGNADLWGEINSISIGKARGVRELYESYFDEKTGEFLLGIRQVRQLAKNKVQIEYAKALDEYKVKLSKGQEVLIKKAEEEFLKNWKGELEQKEKSLKEREKNVKKGEKIVKQASEVLETVKNPETKKSILEKDSKLTEVKKAIKELLKNEKSAEEAIKKLDKMITDKEIDYQTIERLFQEEVKYYAELKTEVDALNIQKENLIKEFLAFQKLEGKIVENDIKKIQNKIANFKEYIESEKAKLQKAHDEVLNQAVVEATYLLEATQAQADEIIKNAKTEADLTEKNAKIEAKQTLDNAKKEAKENAQKVYNEQLEKFNKTLDGLRTKIFDKETLAKTYESEINKQKKVKKKLKKSLSEINAKIRSKKSKLETKNNQLSKAKKKLTEIKQDINSYTYLKNLEKGKLGNYKTANSLEDKIRKKERYIKENRGKTTSINNFSILDENNKSFQPQKSVLTNDDVELAKLILGYWTKLINADYKPYNKKTAKDQLALFKTFTDSISELYSRVSSYFNGSLSTRERYAYNEIERLGSIVGFLNENPEFINQLNTINDYIHTTYMFKGVEMRNIIDTTDLAGKLEKLKYLYPRYYAINYQDGLTFEEALYGKQKDVKKFTKDMRKSADEFILGQEGIGGKKPLDAGQKVNSTPVDRQKHYENITDVWKKAEGNKEKVSALTKWLQNHPMWLNFQKQILNKDVYFEKGLMEFGFSREEAMSMSLLMRKNKGVAGKMIETGRILPGKKVSSIVDAYGLVYNYFLNETKEGRELKKTLKYKKNGQIKSDSFEKMIHSCDLYMYNLYQIDNNEAIKKQLIQNKNVFLSNTTLDELERKFGSVDELLPKLKRVNKIINSDEQTNEDKIRLAAKFDSEDYRKQLEKYFKKAVKSQVITEKEASSYTNKLVFAVQSMSNEIKLKTVFGGIVDMESFDKTNFYYLEKYMPGFKEKIKSKADESGKFIWEETIKEVYQNYIDSYRELEKEGKLNLPDGAGFNDDGEFVIKEKGFNKAWQSIMNNVRQFSNKELLAKNAEIEKELPFVKDYQRMLREYLDEMQQYRVQKSILTDTEVAFMQEFYPNYVPTYREHISFNGTSNVLKGVNVTKDVQKRKGSNELISPLLGSIVDQTYSAVKKGSINSIFNSIEERVGNSDLRNTNDQITLDQEYKEAPKVHSIEELEKALGDQKLAEKENNLITYRRYEAETGYVTKQAVLTNDAMQTFTELESEHALDNFFIFKITSKLTNAFTNLVTTLNPFFLGGNAARDIGDALFTTKHTSAEFAKEYAKSYWQLIGKGKTKEMQDMFDLFVQLGGTAGISYSSDNYRTNFDELLHKQNKVLTTKAGTKFNYSEVLQRANEFVEAMPRFTEFRLSYEKYSKSENLDVKNNAARLAMLDAARITTDFSRGGTLTKTLNRTLVPFLNAQIQGFQKVVDFATDFSKTGWMSFTNPVQRRRFIELLARLLAMGVLPELLSWLMNLGNDDYEALPEYTKAQYLCIPLGGGNFIKIPRGRIIGTVNNFFYQVGQQIAGKKDFKSGVEDFIDVASTNLAPVDLGSGIRTIFSPISDVRNNTTWYGQSIDNTSDLNKYGSQRYDASTSEIGKLIGKVFNYSPKRIDYLLESYTGVVGDILLPLTTKSNYSDIGGTLTNFVTSNLSVNAVKNNRYRGESYELLQNLLYEKNAGSEVGTVQYNYLKRALDECKDLEEVVNQAQTQAEQYTAYLTLREAYKQAISNTELIAQKLQGVSGIDTSDRYTMTELYHQMFGAEYALKYYNSTLGAKTSIAKSLGISAESLYTAYFGVRGVSTTTEAKLIVNQLAKSYYGRLWLKKAVGLSLTSAEETKLSRYLKAKGLSD